MSKDTEDSNPIHQFYLLDIYRTAFPPAQKYTLFSNAHVTFTKIDNMLDHKTSFNKFLKSQVIQNMFSDSKAMTI